MSFEFAVPGASMKKLVILPVIIVLFSSAAHAISIPWEHQTGTRGSGSSAWTYSYDIGLIDNILTIDVDVRLMIDAMFPPDPVSFPTLASRWQNGIESIWSTDRFSIPIEFNVDWVTENYDYAVTVTNAAPRWSLLHWYTIGAGGWGDAYQEEVATHEYGHMIGLYDEYAGGILDPNTHFINTGGLMHTLNGPTLDYYYAPFLGWYETKLGQIPEPSTLLLVSSALLIMIWGVRRKRLCR